jgi:hypothetical protein
MTILYAMLPLSLGPIQIIYLVSLQSIFRIGASYSLQK